VGRHQLASSKRTSSVLLAAVIGPLTVLLAAGGDALATSATRDTRAVEDTPPPCCMEIVAAPAAFSSAPSIGADAVMSTSADVFTAASRMRTAIAPALRIPLPVGDAPEQGLQVRTIQVSRSISAIFPEISNIGGVRPDALRWHPNGLALDVMIPSPGSDTGIALGNEIVSYVMKNADRFGIQDAIWRGVYYTPGGGRAGGYGHYDHVHITTTGGGYPTGNETYFR
jgi:hypothetical protein